MSRRSRHQKRSDKKVVVYARVSTVEQAEKDLSLPAQLGAMREHCDQRGLQIQEEFVEPGASGTDDNRPVFQRMLETVLAPSSNVGMVLVYQTSRFMRNVGKARAVKEALRKNGVRVVSISQETTDDATGRLIEGFFELIDQWESEVNGMRTRAALRENAKRGWFNGSQAPFGFRVEKVEEKPGLWRGQLVPNAEEGLALTEVFRLYVAGTGAKSTARDLNRRGLTYRGKTWSKDLVLKVIDEEAAIGTYYWGKRDSKTGLLRDKEDWIAIEVKPILDRDLFEMAQQARSHRDPVENPGRTGSSPLLLAGLLKCGKCGASYQLETSAKTLADGRAFCYRYYNCRNAIRKGKEVCEGFRIRTDELDQAVLEHLGEKVFTAERCRSVLEQMVEETGVLRQKTAEQRRQFRQELEDIERRIARWEEGFESGEVPQSLGTDRMKELIHRRDEIRGILEKVVPIRPPPYLYTQANIERFQAMLRDLFLSGNNPLTRNYLRFLVEEITVTNEKVDLTARVDAALRLMAGKGEPASENEKTERVNRSALSPSMGLDWLRVCGARARRDRRAVMWRGGRKCWRWIGFSGRSERAERVRVAAG